MSEELPATTPPTIGERITKGIGGAFGAGLVLIVLPSAALVVQMPLFENNRMVGLPILAIFGIMILFGALALTSAVFARLDLSCRCEALALPPGSIRAAIALSLIVLFALIAVMLYQSLSRPYIIEHLTFEQKQAFVQEPKNLILGVLPEPCNAKAPAATKPASAPDEPVAVAEPKNCEAKSLLYTVHLRQPPGTEAADLAKQLLILIGTLMTSVTSFYFASRTAEATTKTMIGALSGGPVGATNRPVKPSEEGDGVAAGPVAPGQAKGLATGQPQPPLIDPGVDDRPAGG